jgi:hypothetical protein
MHIRRTTTRTSATGENHATHRLVERQRAGSLVRHVTLLNLGRHFEVGQEQWPMPCARIARLIGALSALLSKPVAGA